MTRNSSAESEHHNGSLPNGNKNGANVDVDMHDASRQNETGPPFSDKMAPTAAAVVTQEANRVTTGVQDASVASSVTHVDGNGTALQKGPESNLSGFPTVRCTQLAGAFS